MKLYSIGSRVEFLYRGTWVPAQVVDITPNITGDSAIYYLRPEEPYMAYPSEIRELAGPPRPTAEAKLAAIGKILDDHYDAECVNVEEGSWVGGYDPGAIGPIAEIVRPR